MSDEPNLTTAADVMREAVEFNIKPGRMLYPDGSLFVEAETTDLAAVFARAAARTLKRSLARMSARPGTTGGQRPVRVPQPLTPPWRRCTRQ
jgi:hypothetical protein